MAKVWKPKYWDAKNPPDAGSRVFVGKANGASSYEAISAGQTKRILQSNGKGNIFYGNVTVPNPLSPTLESNLPSGDYTSSPEAGIPNALFRIWYSTVQDFSIGMLGVKTDNQGWDLRKTVVEMSAYTGNDRLFVIQRPASYNNFMTLANKMTLYQNDNYYIVIRLQGKNDSVAAPALIDIDVTEVMSINNNGNRELSSANVRNLRTYWNNNNTHVDLVLSNEPSWQI